MCAGLGFWDFGILGGSGEEGSGEEGRGEEREIKCKGFFLGDGFGIFSLLLGGGGGLLSRRLLYLLSVTHIDTLKTLYLT